MNLVEIRATVLSYRVTSGSYGQTDGQTDRQTDGQTDRQTEKVTTIPLRPEWPRGKNDPRSKSRHNE